MVGFDDFFLFGSGFLCFFGGLFFSGFFGIPVPETEEHQQAKDRADEKAFSGEERGEKEVDVLEKNGQRCAQ